MTLKRKILTITIFATAALTYYTFSHVRPIPKSFHTILSDARYLQVLDRHGEALNATYRNRWNIHDVIELHFIPDFLKKAFVISEDQRFYRHQGPDWWARVSALFTNIKAMRTLRGASTITEQVVRMISPRPRTIPSRWIEGFEAGELEKHFTKDEILEFYMNQVPYAANRRGVVQAAHYYFNRTLDTLSKKEMLALAVLVRAPGRLDLWKNTATIENGIKRLAHRLFEKKILSRQEKKTLLAQHFELEAPKMFIDANEFVRHVKNHPPVPLAGSPRIKTTLDGTLQHHIQKMLDHRLNGLKSYNVYNGAVLAVDHTTGEILAWAVAGKDGKNTPGRFIDAVRTPRQPGSALKPFLYALALEKGWSAATVVDDSPLTESVGHGLHSYQNYGRKFYGPITLRKALGNSLNIPGLKTLQYVGTKKYLKTLSNLGFAGLDNHPNFYGDGIALGNGEVTLYELVRAYSAVANRGIYRPLIVFSDGYSQGPLLRVFSPEVSSLIGHILSDPKARDLEFGEHSILNIPVQTAVKTGTSNDYRDSWAVGFNYRYTVGVWMGNLNQRPMDGLTGSLGPALLLRSIFSKLTENRETRPLPIHKKLVKHDLCPETMQIKSDADNCDSITEWFVPGTLLQTTTRSIIKMPIRLRRPSNGLHLAYDPRIPKERQAFEFYIQGVSPKDTVTWNINDKQVTTTGGKYSWPLQKGSHEVGATVWQRNKKTADIKKVKFLVK